MVLMSVWVKTIKPAEGPALSFQTARDVHGGGAYLLKHGYQPAVTMWLTGEVLVTWSQATPLQSENPVPVLCSLVFTLDDHKVALWCQAEPKHYFPHRMFCLLELRGLHPLMETQMKPEWTCPLSCCQTETLQCDGGGGTTGPPKGHFWRLTFGALPEWNTPLILKNLQQIPLWEQRSQPRLCINICLCQDVTDKIFISNTKTSNHTGHVHHI